MPERIRKCWPYLFVIAAVLLVSRDWWNTALLGGHSSPFDFFRQVALHDAITHGELWPRFNTLFYYGYGSLLFHFYAPFSYYLTEIFVLLGAPVAVAIKLAMATGLLLSGVFMVMLVRELFGDWAAATAGALYVLAPYHLVDVLARHALGEAIAFAWLPLAFWGVLGAVRDGSAPRALAGAIGLALLVLTHNITAMISAPLLGVWWLFLTVKYRGQGKRGPLMGVVSGVGGLMLSVFFWLPAMAEKGLVWSEQSLTYEYFQYWKHFVYFKQFFSLFWGHGGSRPGLKDTLPYQIGLAHWLMLAGSLIVVFKKQKWRSWLLVFLGMFLFAVMMAHWISKPVWDAISLLAFVQFPWRFLVLAVFAGSIAAAVVAEWIREIGKKNWGPALALCIVCLSFVVYAPYTYSRHTLYDTKNDHHRHLLKEKYDKRVQKKRWERLEEIATPYWLGTRLTRATAREDFLPKTVKTLPSEPIYGEVLHVSSDAGEVLNYKTYGYSTKGSLSDVIMERPGKVILHRFWFPGWRARVNGQPAETAPTDIYGLVSVDVPAGSHEVEFDFGSTPLRTGAGVVSLLTALGFVILLLVFRRRGLPNH